MSYERHIECVQILASLQLYIIKKGNASNERYIRVRTEACKEVSD